MKKSRLFKHNNQYWEFVKKVDCYILYINNQKENSWSYLLFSMGGSVVVKTELKSRKSAIKNGEVAAKLAKKESVDYVDRIIIFLKNQK